MSRFFLILIVIVFSGFSSGDGLHYVFGKVNKGGTIETNDDYNKFKKVADDPNNEELSLMPDVCISIAKYNLKQGEYVEASKYFNKALNIIEIPDDIKEDKNKYCDELLSYFPSVLVKLLLRDSVDISVEKCFSTYPTKNIHHE